MCRCELALLSGQPIVFNYSRFGPKTVSYRPEYTTQCQIGIAVNNTNSWAQIRRRKKKGTSRRIYLVERTRQAHCQTLRVSETNIGVDPAKGHIAKGSQ